MALVFSEDANEAVVVELVLFFPSFRPSFLPVLQKEEQSDRERWQHLADLADFALAMKVTLMNINYQSFNNFMLRIGASSVFTQLMCLNTIVAVITSVQIISYI